MTDSQLWTKSCDNLMAGGNKNNKLTNYKKHINPLNIFLNIKLSEEGSLLLNG
jgi:hypothetical protein